MSSDDLNQAIALIKAGQKSQARKLLLHLLEQDQRNEAAWLWLAQTLPDDAQRIRALERCLSIFPESEKARRGLEVLRARQAGVAQPPAPEIPPASLSQPAAPAADERQEPALPLDASEKVKKKSASRRSPTRRWIVYLIAGIGLLLGAVLGGRAFSAVQSLWLGKLPLGRARMATPGDSPVSTTPAPSQTFDWSIVSPSSPLSPSTTPASSQTLVPLPTFPPLPSATPVPPTLPPRVLPYNRLLLRLLPSETCNTDTIDTATGEWFETLEGPAKCGEPRSVSPDRQQIAYYAVTPDQNLAGIYVSNLDGSQEHPVVGFNLESREWGDSAFLGALSWIDNEHISYLANTQPGNASPLSPGIVRLNIITSEIEVLSPQGMLIDPGTVDRRADWSPNGLWVFTYVRTPTCSLPACPAVLTLDGTLAFPLPEEYAWINPAWSPDNMALAFVHPARQESLVVYNLDGQTRSLESVSVPFALDSPPAWSPDGKQLAAADLETNLLLYSVEGDKFPVTLTAGLEPGKIEQITWSPDGRQIAFIRSDRGGTNSWLWLVNSDGANLRKLYKARRGPVWWYSLENRGALLPAPLYLRDPTVREIFRLEVDGVTLQQVTQTGGCVSEFSSSPEAGALAYVACERLYISDLQGGSPQVIQEGGSGLRWSPDGAQLAFYKDGVRIYSLVDGRLRDALGGKSQANIGSCGPACYAPLAWSPDGSLLILQPMDRGQTIKGEQLLTLAVSGSQPARPLEAWLLKTNIYNDATFLGFSPDGLSLLMGAQGLQDPETPVLTQVDLDSGTATPLWYARPAISSWEYSVILRAPHFLPDGRLAFLYGNRGAGKGSDYYRVVVVDLDELDGFTISAQYPQDFPINFPRDVLWSADGALLVVGSDNSLAVYQDNGSLLFSLPITAYQLGWGRPAP